WVITRNGDTQLARVVVGSCRLYLLQVDMGFDNPVVKFIQRFHLLVGQVGQFFSWLKLGSLKQDLHSRIKFQLNKSFSVFLSSRRYLLPTGYSLTKRPRYS